MGTYLDCFVNDVKCDGAGMTGGARDDVVDENIDPRGVTALGDAFREGLGRHGVYSATIQDIQGT